MKILTKTICVFLALLLLCPAALLFSACKMKLPFEKQPIETTDENGTPTTPTGEEQGEATKKGLQKYARNSSGYGYAQTLNFAGGYDQGATALRDEILNAPNTEEIYADRITGKKFRITKDMTMTDVRRKLIAVRAGDAVLFERGGLWRIGCGGDFYIPSGVVFGAYGEGEKPKFYGSLKNYAGDPGWYRSPENPSIWQIELDKNADVGNIVFDEVACLGVRQWAPRDVVGLYDFYFNADIRMLYIYYPGDLPNDFTSIEISQKGKIVQMYPHTVLDNICLRYTGWHAVTAGEELEDINVTNCEVGFIGGSVQGGYTRFGNGIELQLGSINSTVSHNWVYQCYDSGITFQSWNTGTRQDTHYHNLTISDNLVEFCFMGIEYFTTNLEVNGSDSDYKNISITGNVLRFAGYDWGYKQRPDPQMCSQIRGGQWAWVPDTENFVISDNVFDCAYSCTIFWWWNDPNRDPPFIHPEPHPGLTVEHNTYYISKPITGNGMLYRNNEYIKVYNLADAQAAIAKFDSDPTAIVWISRIGRETD